MIFFILGCIKIDKYKKLLHLTSLNHEVKRCGQFHKHKIFYLDYQYFYF